MADTIYMNRELSWLKFNERVLEEAENPENPLCERLTFASIYQSNLDEFYMVRVGSLVDQMLLAKDIRENKTNMTPKEQLDAILARTKKLNRKRDVVYEEIMESLEEYGVHMLNFHKIEKEDRNYLRCQQQKFIYGTGFGIRKAEIAEKFLWGLSAEAEWKEILRNVKTTSVVQQKCTFF